MFFRGAIIVLAAAVFFGVASTWVPTENKRIAGVVEEFYDAYNIREFDSALNLMRGNSENSLREKIKLWRDTTGKMRFRLLDIKVNGEEAVVTVLHSDKTAKHLRLGWRLQKNNDTWQIMNLPQPTISLPDTAEPDSQKVFQNIYLGLGNRQLL